MAEETVEVEFLHHYTDRRGDKPVAHLPGTKAAFPVAVARSLVGGKVATYATKKAEKTATAPTAG